MKKQILRSPLFYVGDKYKLMEEISTYFPANIDKFIEPFVGGGSVFMNTVAGQFYLNDIDSYIIRLHKYLCKAANHKKAFFADLEAIIKKYRLSYSCKEDNIPTELKRQFKKTYLAKYNKESYEQMRFDFNDSSKDNMSLLYLLLIYGFNRIVAIYTNNDPNVNTALKGHKEAGYPRGWPSRFDTQFKLMKVLGFVYYEWGKPIELSQTGHYLADTITIGINDGVVSREIVNPQGEQIAFMQAFAKQQRCNPFIRELNDNIPLILLLEVIKKLNADSEYNGTGISYKEIPLVIFWKDNDAEVLYQRIKHLRNEHGYNPSNEVIENICVNEILGGFKKFKLKSIVSEYPDDFVRKMRMTGLISFRGGGRFIDINHNEDKKIDYILNHYAKYTKFTTEKEYFDYMSTIDDELFALRAVEVSKTDAAEKLVRLLSEYPWDSIKKELSHLANKTSSNHNILKFIPAPARLEFLTALAIKSKRPEVEVIPNYPCDDEGLPTSTAGGNNGDIECIEEPNSILIEVTMAEGRQQTMMEVWPIARHMEDFDDKYETIDTQCIFVAPSIFSDTKDQIDWVKDRKQIIIRPYKIVDFINFLDSTTTLYCESL